MQISTLDHQRDAAMTHRCHGGRMASTDRYLSLAKSLIPLLAAVVFAIAQGATQFGVMIIPFFAVAALGVVQAVRSSGVISSFSSRKELRGSVAETSHRGRSVADQILDER